MISTPISLGAIARPNTWSAKRAWLYSSIRGGRFRKANLNTDTEIHRHEDSNTPIGIVGASAAGLFAAALFARAGRQVRLFERAEVLNPAARTLIVTDRIRKLLGASSTKCEINEIHAIELFTDGRSAGIELDSPDLVVERSRLIRALADEAQSHGVQFEFGRRFASLQAGRRGALELVLVDVRDMDYRTVCCSAIVGADGAQSSVAQSAGWSRLNTVPLVQAIVNLPSGVPSDTVRVWFIPDDTPYFYWLIPQSRTRAALGLIGTEGQRTRRCLERFMENRQFKPISFQGARIPLYEDWVPVERKIGAGCIYLVGDAAAQVKVTTLGGIVTGFRGALGLSELILNGGISPELRALRRELDFHKLIRRGLQRFRQSDYSRLLDCINDGMSHSLNQANRDDAARMLWHVCRNQPRLLWMGLRGLFARPPGLSAQDSAAGVSV